MTTSRLVQTQRARRLTALRNFSLVDRVTGSRVLRAVRYTYTPHALQAAPQQPSPAPGEERGDHALRIAAFFIVAAASGVFFFLEETSVGSRTALEFVPLPLQ